MLNVSLSLFPIVMPCLGHFFMLLLMNKFHREKASTNLKPKRTQIFWLNKKH